MTAILSVEIADVQRQVVWQAKISRYQTEMKKLPSPSKRNLSLRFQTEQIRVRTSSIRRNEINYDYGMNEIVKYKNKYKIVS
jgi:hypothetical protein